MSATATDRPVVLFDGVCNLCNASVNFVLDRDPDARFVFAPLQSPVAAEMLRERGERAPDAEPASIVLIEGPRVTFASTAALRVARQLRGPIKLLYALIVFPRPLRDLVYRFIARHRYRWFGKSDTCRVPTPELRARFLA